MNARILSGEAPFGLALLTLTVSAPSPQVGFEILTEARASFFRKRTPASSFVGGVGQVFPEPSGSHTGELWNVHLHAVVELGIPIDAVKHADLAASWANVLAKHDATGSLDLRQDANLRVEYFLDGQA